MTPKFDDLIYQSGLIADGCWDELGTYEQEAIERLMELIVKECAKLASEETSFPHDSYSDKIKVHFGVE
jgi:hypothetical protein